MTLAKMRIKRSKLIILLPLKKRKKKARPKKMKKIRAMLLKARLNQSLF